ncbi:hypothetical protein SBOR_0143 [Sclerotinia borealis F-4128]|uniref:Uncharacterized protein n=1 Tax=Sclerotinia borealis (strain F-4128) TaxID=1432307 RepID=W9CXX7_SCLBF|nr:hypothetical protein SBOR_0143 [Sclerotinia borealis F-4128]
MTYIEPIILESDREDDDSREYSPLAESSRKSSATMHDSILPNEQDSHNTRSRRRMADHKSVGNVPSTHSQQEKKNPKTKRSRSPSPFSMIPEAPPSKRRIYNPPIKPWIKNDDIFMEVQDKLSLYGLGLYGVPVASDKWLPFNVQSKILNRAQNLLEEALFEFLHKTWPELCAENGWEEMGEAELNELAPVMMAGIKAHNDEIEQLIDFYNPQVSVSLPYLLEKIGQIRHCAVHRTKKIPVIIIELMVRDASYITMYLKDDERTKALDNLCRPLEPLSFNLQARFGDELEGRVERELKRTSAEIEKIKEALRIEEEREKKAQMQMEHIKAQDEKVYEGELEALRKSL